eukprot:4882634-Prymnesium_polylepis.1
MLDDERDDVVCVDTEEAVVRVEGCRSRSLRRWCRSRWCRWRRRRPTSRCRSRRRSSRRGL